jgi:hypothetical protein
VRVGADGSLFYLARDEGRVYRVVFTGNQAPAIINGDFPLPKSVFVTGPTPAALRPTAGRHPFGAIARAGDAAGFAVARSGRRPGRGHGRDYHCVELWGG